MFTAFAMFAGVAYWYYTDTQKALAVAAANQAKLETSLSIQKETTASLQADIKLKYKIFLILLRLDWTQ